MNDVDVDLGEEKTAPHREVVRLTTAYWADARGLHCRKNLRVQRRQTPSGSLLEEDAQMIGVGEVWPRITNLAECPDGEYVVGVVNERRDWESGLVDEYDYILIPVEVTHG